MSRTDSRWLPTVVDRARRAAHRARQQAGPERETALLLAKSGAAGVMAWALGAYVIGSPQPTYAPFTALLVVQSTAYRSVLQSLRYVVAVVLGVLAAGLVGPLIGENTLAFAVMLAITLLIGRWRHLGSQGIQVSIAGAFAYNALSGTHVQMLWEIIQMALLGAGVGIALAMLVFPPLRYRTAERGIEEITQATQLLLHDMAECLKEGLPDEETAEDWLHRARQLDNTLGAAREAVEMGAESVVYNPRTWLHRRTAPRSFQGYRTLMESLGRAGEQIRSISYGFVRFHGEDATRPEDDFLSAYGELLESISEAAGLIGSLEDDEGDDPLRRTLRQCRERYARLCERAEGEAWPSHGVLLTDADRLLVEFRHAHRQGAAQPPRRS
ncbi:aromatic acid exporter family protein [Streptomyces sp. PU-14G]|uniref:FUSC family protein n=1 Tax=Streptomyces sp. PU-14G TaxID=2800808 RepID=UPI0034E0378F